jgi:hypothetical protein
MTRNHFVLLRTLCVMIVGVLVNAVAMAADPSTTLREHTSREIYVPFSDLHILLEREPKRVFLSRDEYADLMRKAQKSPETHAPQSALMTAADYTVAVEQGQAHLEGILTIDVLEAGLHRVPLELGGVGLQEAKLDDRNAPMGRAGDGKDNGLGLFVEGVGRHTLRLVMTAPVETTAASQTLVSGCRIPLPRSSI